MASKKKSSMKRLTDSDSDSGPEDRNPPPKRAKGSDTKKKSGGDGASDEGDGMFKLSKMRFVSVSEFRGKVLVNIREYYNADGDLKPGKKGISLSTEQWEALKGHIESIDEAIKKY